ncbi:hypothetical protein CPBF426_25730 [Xanthomonas arboricola pv. juglandis]|uniref:sce7726 family protein n=1 Tax=Xanthomonas TaxID=338 RepID=UPI000E7F35DD|nr:MULTISPECIES: sce7726 family protein [Xanthomonas]CAD1790180.1 sce7726 family protein [Xanthomonas sp. CPBF 426]CAG2087842.1 sce7726 family protein [Xanthomonas euroxanthea]SYZ54440.1 hypothetical protein CPBF426_25730 [Xanthomonas arboricola pv. juglandis]
MYADDIKAVIVSAILPTLNFDEVLGSEVRFGDGRYRADLVISSPSRLSAIEIKGPRDNLDKLGGQVLGYSEMFLDFSVATDANWISTVRERLPRSTGLMALREDELVTVRMPRERSRLTSNAALKWLKTEDLRKIMREKKLPVTGHYESLAEATRQHIPGAELSNFALRTVHERLLPRFEAFRNELGHTVTLDDVRMLTLNENISQRP